ncbi:MAG: hypothetical protein H0U49_05700 [Parachlamydiaceae bacterium]|nr:hypothetical protein [Parachlamydiaceae bacterium]
MVHPFKGRKLLRQQIAKPTRCNCRITAIFFCAAKGVHIDHCKKYYTIKYAIEQALSVTFLAEIDNQVAFEFYGKNGMDINDEKKEKR